MELYDSTESVKLFLRRRLLCRQGPDDASRLLETETEGHRAVGAAVADRASRRIGTLEMGLASGNLLSVMEPVQTTKHGQTMIYGLRCGLWLLVQLMTNIVHQRGLCDHGNRLMLAPIPASEVQQVIGVGANRARRQLTKMLGIEKNR